MYTKALAKAQQVYNAFVIRFISLVLSAPRLIIILPCIIAFVIAYDVLYDFTIKQFNSQLASHFGGVTTSNFNTNTKSNNMADELAAIDFSSSKSLTGIFLTRNDQNVGPVDKEGVVGRQVYNNNQKKFSDGSNIFDWHVFQAVEDIVANITNTYKDAIVISPTSALPIEVPTPDSNSKVAMIRNYFIKYFNYDINNLLTFLFFDRLVKSNHIIMYAEVLRIYIISNAGTDIERQVQSILQESYFPLQLYEVVKTTNKRSISDFIHYYFVQNYASFGIQLFLSTSNALILISILGFSLYVYLSISNQHKIRSSVGLLIGWTICSLISCAASVNIIRVFHNYQSWRLIFEPSTVYTKGSYVFTVMLLSSRNLFSTIRSLSEGDVQSDLHKRLHNYYKGWYGLPVTLKNLFFNVSGILIFQFVGIHIMSYYTQGYFFEYIKNRLFRLGEAIVLGLLIEYLLELSYIAGIIVIDLKRMDLTDYIQHHQSFNQDRYLEIDEVESGSQELDGVNVFSSWLLNLRAPSHLRPERSTFRYKLGQFFLTVNYNTDFKGYGLSVFSFGLIQLLGIFIHWLLVIPYNLSNETSTMIGLGETTILSNTKTLIYYLELLTVVVFIIAISSLAFKLASGTPTSTNASTVNLSEKDFEQETRYFNAIELAKNPMYGHNLDIIKIEANSKTSFVVTIGLDHRVLVWSPLSVPLPKPIDISTSLRVGPRQMGEFWPINHVSISDDGSYVVLFNYRFGLFKCFERKELCYRWESKLSGDLLQLIETKKFKILTSFFRRITVPGFLARKMLMRKKAKKSNNATRSRKGSDASIASINSNINSNFPPPPISMKSFGEQQREKNEPSEEQLEKQIFKEDFTLVLESGDLITFSCSNGKPKSSNILTELYGEEAHGLILTSALKVTTPRVNDRIVCQVSNSDVVVATVVNNNWRFRKLAIKEGSYNQESHISPIGKPISNVQLNDFSSVYNEKKLSESTTKSDNGPTKPRLPEFQINKSTIVGVDFVGMIVLVKDQVAELIDVQSGIVLKKFNVGRFKPKTFRVSHSEPTHCKFCGCASIQSFSILYEDFDSPTLIMHTYKIDYKRSKTSICLRVERDPREIRCLGFNAVTDHQYWYNNVVGWELTDVNMVIGLRKRDKVDDDENNHKNDEYSEEEIPSLDSQNFNSIIDHSGLMSLRSRRARKVPVYKPEDRVTVDKIWESFIITVRDGQLINYQIPLDNRLRQTEIVLNRITCVKKYGYKSVIFSVGNTSEIFYLGNDKLIEDDLYYSGTNATIWSVLEEDAQNNSPATPARPEPGMVKPQTVNSELLFINKRRKMRERHNAPGVVR
ncbi:uncharacterized protein RJT20DRAFT_129315 [Scheffersomyces xylosifermentans]|uniref:uncharacterized protein n=1 Tax=Scheffersomyces xylosifermentans TaxID=1304137 RepID=UPI00315C7605